MVNCSPGAHDEAMDSDELYERNPEHLTDEVLRSVLGDLDLVRERFETELARRQAERLLEECGTSFGVRD